MNATRFLHHRGARLPALFSFIARVPAGAMVLLLPLMSLSMHLSPLVSAASLGICRVAQGVAGPLWGRYVDRRSLRIVLVISGSGQAIALLLAAVIPVAEPAVMLTLAAVVGALALPMNGLMRATWNRCLASEEDRQSANAFESVLAEGVLLFGRLLVAAATLVVPMGAIVGSQAVLVAVGSLGLAGTAMLRTDCASGAQTSPNRSVRGLRSRLGILFSFFLTSSSLGAFSFVLILAAGGSGSAASALAIALWGAGSIIGTAVLPLAKVALSPAFNGTALLLVVMGVIQLIGNVHSLPLPWLLAAAAAAGMPIAAIVTGLYDRLQREVPAGRQSEYFAWATTMLFGGDAFGVLVAGLVFDESRSLTLAATVATVCALVASVWILRNAKLAG